MAASTDSTVSLGTDGAPQELRSSRRLPTHVHVAVIGGGFAGAATAAALATAGAGPGVILEREALPGTHASGRNAALARQVEFDEVIRSLAIDGVQRMRAHADAGRGTLVDDRGGVYIASAARADMLATLAADLKATGIDTEVWTAARARRRVPFLSGIDVGAALFCASDGMIQIHDVLSSLLATAKQGGFPLATRCAADDLLIEAGRVTGVVTTLGTLRADLVVDATGAWAGRLGRASAPLPLRPLRRHLFVSGDTPTIPRDAPILWDLDAGYYFRPEGAGLLLSPCDESEHVPAPPDTDPAATVLLAEKLTRHAPALANLEVRRGWACLRTFAPDRRPVIGFDPQIGGLFHVAALGGFGATTAMSVGALAASLIAAGAPHPLDPRRFAGLTPQAA